MAKTLSTMLPLGTNAPSFELLEPKTGQQVALASFLNQPVMVAFICNHCPFVKHIAKGIASFANDYQQKGMAVIAINSNDVANYPDDSPEMMLQEISLQGYNFPYLYDASQEVALAYRAACTPDFFLFDAAHKLVYRGQFDAARPGNSIAVSGADIRSAADALLAGKSINSEQTPSVGCNIKWLAGNQPNYT